MGHFHHAYPAIPFWKRTYVDVRRKQHCLEKIDDLHEEYRKFSKLKSEKSKEVFIVSLEQVFDISKSSYSYVMTNEQKDLISKKPINEIDQLFSQAKAAGKIIKIMK